MVLDLQAFVRVRDRVHESSSQIPPGRRWGRYWRGRAEGKMARRGSEPKVVWKGVPAEHRCAGPTGTLGFDQVSEEEGELAIEAGTPEQQCGGVAESQGQLRGRAEQHGCERQDTVLGGVGGDIRRVGWARPRGL